MMQKRNSKGGNFIKRDSGTEALSIGPVDGLYNQPLFDLDSEDAIVSFTLLGGYNRALDAIGFVNSNVHLIKRNFLTYVAPAGTADGSPVSSAHADACAPGTGVESGGCSYLLEGWGRMRKSSDTRDITDLPIRYSSQRPIYDIGGNMIDDDYEWDVVRQTTVMLQDLQRFIINGNKSNAGEADGLLQLVTYGYTDPETGEACTSMDSTVIDYNGNSFAPENGATGVTFNGDAVTDGYAFYDYVASFLRLTRQRIAHSSLSGMPTHIGLIPTEHLNCLIDAWVCHTHCGGNKEWMMESEVQAMLNQLKNTLMAGQNVTLTFHGVPVVFFPYDYGLLSAGAEPGDPALATILILTPNVGNTPLVRIQVKDMSAVAATPPAGSEYMVSDNSRILSWKTLDHTCYRIHTELQWRVDMPGPWAQMKIIDVACDSIYGAKSGDPLSTFFFEGNLVSYPKASGFVTQVAPVANNDFYTREVGASSLVVAAGSGLLVNDTGTPAPAATAVTTVATTEGGTITITVDGGFTYVPPSATFEGVDTYVYTITNAAGSDTATVTIVTYDEAA
jgi:hypothetical protein